MKRNFRIPLLFFAVFSLLSAMWAGLIRIGWRLPIVQPLLPIGHGPLMVSGFLGTLLILERSVAIGKRWPYLGSFMCGIGGVLVTFGVGGLLGPILLTIGSFWMVLIFIHILRTHRATYSIVMALGALSWLTGSVLWLLGKPIPLIVFWWAGFLILTIVGERLELGRIVKLSNIAKTSFNTAVITFISGLLVMLWDYPLGVKIAGIGLLLQALWLLKNDIARKTIRQTGLTRFVAVCMLAGHVWLIIAGTIAIFLGGVMAGPIYDAMLHSIFIGFVFSMIFGHAPIIFPAILELPIEYRPTLYVPLVLLHTSLIIRILGDLAGFAQIRLWGGMFNALTLLLFFAMIAPIKLFDKNK
jgi:hypothetical protein